MKVSIQKDIKKFVEKYPKFSMIPIDNTNYIKLQGVIDIVDIEGVYWDSYEISILLLKQNYPHITPKVFETTEKIKREDDWHISVNGECCLDIIHKMILLENKGIDIISFYQNKIYPFFANHAFKLKTGEYANGDYPHQFDGIKYFYENDLRLKDVDLTILLLTSITNHKLPSRNAICLCKQRKYKYCHLPIAKKLMLFGQKRLLDDLLFFKLESLQSS